MSTRTIRIWDLPTRLFHWLLLLLVVASFVTGWVGGNLIEWHARAGIAITGLLAFRLVWGFVGSTYARFAHFVPGPGRLLTYVRGQWRGLGHNPLGALSVLALLAILIFQDFLVAEPCARLDQGVDQGFLVQRGIQSLAQARLLWRARTALSVVRASVINDAGSS